MPQGHFDILKQILFIDPDMPMSTFSNRFVYINEIGFLRVFKESLIEFTKANQLEVKLRSKAITDARNRLRSLMSQAESEGILAPAVLSKLTSKEMRFTTNKEGEVEECPWSQFQTPNQLLEYCYHNKINLCRCAQGIEPKTWKERGKGVYVKLFFFKFFLKNIVT